MSSPTPSAPATSFTSSSSFTTTSSAVRGEPSVLRLPTNPTATGGGCMRLVRCLVPVVFLVALPLFAQTLEIHYIDVGWGGSVFIKGPTGITVLLEAGNTGMGTQYVVPYLKSIGVQPAIGIDYVVGGQQHCDHIGGLDEVINVGYNVRIKQYYNGSTYASSCVDQWNAAAATTTAGAPVTMPVGTVIQLGNGATLT